MERRASVNAIEIHSRISIYGVLIYIHVALLEYEAMSRVLSTVNYSPKGYWTDKAAETKLLSAAKVSETGNHRQQVIVERFNRTLAE